jgi:TetR/AcrR family transcriptional regulator, tetracycline repressor protein
LAHKLGVSTMALYNHVNDKQDLLQAIAQDVAEELRIPPATGDWQQRLRAIFRTLRQVCLANPRAVPVIEKAEVLPAIFRPMEAALAALKQAGLGSKEGMQAYFLLTNFTLGQASYEIRGPFRGLDPAEAVQRRTILSRDFPLVVEAASTAAEWDFDAAFEFGLDIIIDGLAARSSEPLPGSKARRA